MNTEYFASKDKKDLAADLEESRKSWADRLETSGLKGKWNRSYQLYYGEHFHTTSSLSNQSIRDMGESGELKGVALNHYRNFIKHVLSLTTNQKPSYQCRATNSDLKSLQQAKLGNTILDSYLVGKRGLRYMKKAAEQSLLFGKGFVKTHWEISSGEPYTVETFTDNSGEKREKLIYEGDVVYSNPGPFDVRCDPSAEEWGEVQWIEVRTFRNKFDLAVRYNELEDELLQTPSDGYEEGRWDAFQYWNFSDIDEEVMIPVYEFYHKRTDALPNGRYMLFSHKNAVLYDGPIPYDRLPVHRITPGEIFGTTEGYTDAFDLHAPQQALNTVVSAIFSNLNAFGVQNVLIPEGCNLTTQQISEALAGLKYNPQAGKPEALQLTTMPAGAGEFLGLMESAMEKLSGINSVVRGDPESSLKSGVALALVQSMAVQYASGYQESWANLIEDSGTFTLDLLKSFAKTERMVAMVGKHNRGQIKHFKADDLQGVDRVVVELGNPLMRTTAGRTQIADHLLDKGLVDNAQQYLQVIETGSLDPLTEGKEAELDNVRQENEMLMEGNLELVQPMVGDAHLFHMREHKALLSNPEVRSNSEITKMVVAHIQAHMELYRNQDPIWSEIAGEPPAQQPAPPPPPPQGAPGQGDIPEALGPGPVPGIPPKQATDLR